jgi:hypothetical protein
MLWFNGIILESAEAPPIVVNPTAWLVLFLFLIGGNCDEKTDMHARFRLSTEYRVPTKN